MIFGYEKEFRAFREGKILCIKEGGHKAFRWGASLNLSLAELPAICCRPFGFLGGDLCLKGVVRSPAGIGKIQKDIFFRPGSGKGEKSFLTFVVVTSVSVNTQWNHTFDILVPDGVGCLNGARQYPLRHGKKEHGEKYSANQDGVNDGTQVDATSHHGSKFIVMAQYPKADHSRKQDQHRTQHIKNKRDGEQEELQGKSYGFTSGHEFINFLKEIDQDVDCYKGGGHNYKAAEELEQNIAVKKVHVLFYQRRNLWLSIKPAATIAIPKKLETAR